MNEWISVKDRLPEKTGSLIVFCDGISDCGYYFHDTKDFDADGMADGGNEIVTHWMPLPEPPINE